MNFYEEQLNDILKEWESNSFLKERIHILRDIIEAHKESKYTLSIPAIFPQLEWIIIEITGIKGKTIYDCMLKELKNKIVKNKYEFTSFSFENSLYMAIESLLNIDFRWGEKVEKLGRHSVLHGAFSNYNSKLNSLKLILLFHQLQKFLILLQERRPNDSSSIH